MGKAEYRIFEDIFGHTVLITDRVYDLFKETMLYPLDRDMVEIYTDITIQKNPDVTDDLVLSRLVNTDIVKNMQKYIHIPAELLKLE